MKVSSAMKGLFIVSILSIVIISGLISPVSGYELSEKQSGILNDSNQSITFFYNQNCGSCRVAILRIAEISDMYPDIDIRTFNTYNSTENRTLLRAFGEKYNCPFPGIPIIFAGDMTLLVGAPEIDEHIDDLAEALRRGEIPSRSYESRWGGEVPETVHAETTVISYPLVAGAGLLDGINPCAFAVLVVLLAGLMVAGSRRKMLANGLSYAAGVFVFYFLSGLGIFTVVQTAGIVNVFTLIAAAVALCAGVIQVVEGFSGERIVGIAMPRATGDRLKNFASRASVPSAFVIGMGVGIFELPCTGGIYIAILGMLSFSVTFGEGIPYLLLYNLMFVLPLLVITLLLAFGLPPERVNEWRIRNRKFLRITLGLVLVCLGLYLLLSRLLLLS